MDCRLQQPTAAENSMGTVGLNFGSPMSGTGFDVDATVQRIVTNLQRVESPWKTQLAQLQSQDTVLSSLGTLLSTLSTDLGKLTDFTGMLAQKTGSSSDTNVLQLTSATSSAMAGTHTVKVKSLAQTSSGYLAPIANAADTLSGSISIQVGTGKAHTVNVSSSNSTLAGLAAAINAAGFGVTANVLTDANGSRLSLVSRSSGAAGDLTVTSSVVDTTDSNKALGYTAAVQGLDAQLTVDGADMASASNTVSGLIPGVTFQLLGLSDKQADGSLVPVQVVIGNDNNGVETAVNTLVTDFNAVMQAIDAQQGKDSSGNPEPLFGSPTLSLLQQQLLSSVNAANPSGFPDPISAGDGTALSGSMTLQVGNGTTQTVVIGAAPDPPDANTIYTGGNTATLQDLADAINAANLGVTAGTTSSYGQSTLSLISQTAGNAGALSVSSSLAAAVPTALGYTAADDTSGALDVVADGADVLAGSLTIQVGSGAAQTVTIGVGSNTLQGLADAINGTASIGITASVQMNADGSAQLVFAADGSSMGKLVVTSNVVDTTHTKSNSIGYTNSSDISTLANLGITSSTNYDGTLTFDPGVLDAALNTDFSGVLGFFQGLNSWGQSVAKILTSMGNTSSSGILKLAQNANSNMEKTLNDDVAKQEALIATQQKSLTAQLNTANQILQSLPSQLDGINMLYSAITGYNQKQG
jgi:flagellar hook-associated protein 2